MCHARRAFLAGAVLSTGSLPLLSSLAAAGEDEDAQQAAIDAAVKKCRDEQSKRQMADRARYFKRLVERFGPEILEEVKQTTIDGVRRRMEQAELKDRGLSAVKTELWDNLPPDFEVTVVEDTPQALEYKVTKCPLATVMLEHEAGEIGFAFSCAWDYGFVEGLNPKIQFTRTKTLMMGNDCCNHAYRL